MDWNSLGDTATKMYNRLNPIQEPQSPVFDFNYETPALDAYQKHVSALPDYNNYKPSALRRIAGALGGFSTGWTKGPSAGFDVAEKIVQAPYNNALTQWQRQGQGLASAAQAEAASGKNEANRQSALMKYYGTLNTNNNRREMNTENNNTKQTIAAQKTNILAEQLRQAGLDKELSAPIIDSDGQAFAYSKKTGELIQLGPENNFFGDAQKAAAAMERVKAQVQGSLGVANINAGSRAQVANINAANDLEVAGVNQAGATQRTQMTLDAPSKQVIGDDKKIQSFVIMNPEFVNEQIVKPQTDSYGKPTGKYYIDFDVARQKPDVYSKFQAKFGEFGTQRRVTPPARFTAPAAPKPTTTTPNLKYRKVNP